MIYYKMTASSYFETTNILDPRNPETNVYERVFEG